MLIGERRRWQNRAGEEGGRDREGEKGRGTDVKAKNNINEDGGNSHAVYASDSFSPCFTQSHLFFCKILPPF